MTKEHLEGRAAALDDVLKILDILIEELRYTSALKRLRLELAKAKEATVETAKTTPSVYDQGFRAGEDVGFDRGYESGYEARRGRPLYS